jgi:hypothetical protein
VICQLPRCSKDFGAPPKSAPHKRYCCRQHLDEHRNTKLRQAIELLENAPSLSDVEIVAFVRDLSK